MLSQKDGQQKRAARIDPAALLKIQILLFTPLNRRSVCIT
ncbi:MAG: hypothetical protein JWP45_3527 [Mucilaginibacter sp.]|nr:hypothetical protein [Mucilaginibacter sp.]